MFWLNLYYKGILFSALDQEDDKFVIRDCQETLLCLLGSIDSKNLSSWIVLCKEILTTCSGAAEDNQEEEKETDDDDAVFTKGKGGGHLYTFKQPKLFCGYRPHLLIYFDEMLYGSLY